MTFLDAAHLEHTAALDPNRPDAVGLALSAVLPLAAVVIAGTLIPMTAWPSLPLPIPGWAQELLILMLFPMWGAARWTLAQEGAEGRAASWWVVALIAMMLAYTYIGAHIDTFFLGWLNLVVLLVAGTATARAGAVSSRALGWMLPSLAILGLGAIQGYMFVTNGWSPGFAVTVAMARQDS